MEQDDAVNINEEQSRFELMRMQKHPTSPHNRIIHSRRQQTAAQLREKAKQTVAEKTQERVMRIQAAAALRDSKASAAAAASSSSTNTAAWLSNIELFRVEEKVSKEHEEVVKIEKQLADTHDELLRIQATLGKNNDVDDTIDFIQNMVSVWAFCVTLYLAWRYYKRKMGQNS
jgi:hypothetical protein